MAKATRKTTRKNLTLRMNTELQERLRIQAIKEKRFFSDLLEEALLQYLTEKSA